MCKNSLGEVVRKLSMCCDIMVDVLVVVSIFVLVAAMVLPLLGVPVVFGVYVNVFGWGNYYPLLGG